jgi:hypothetical protein
VAAFLAGVHFGTVGVAAAYSITYLGLLMIPGFAIPFRLIGLKLSTFFRAMLPQLLLTGAMTLLCWIWLRILETMSVTNPWVQLLSTSFLGAAAYSSSFVLLWPAVMGHLEDALGTSHKGARLAGYLLQARQLCMRGIRRLSFSGS